MRAREQGLDDGLEPARRIKAAAKRHFDMTWSDYWRAHACVLAVWATCIASAMIAAQSYGFALDFAIYGVFPLVTIVLALLALVVMSARELVVHRPERPFHHISRRMIADWQVPRRLVMAVPVVIGTTVYMSVFSSLKSAIPFMVPYYLDPMLVQLDRALFFGHDAWRVLQPVLGFPAVTFTINLFYNGWLLVICATFFGAALMVKETRLRAQYLIAFFLSWAVIGSVLATVFSSVGPCFYAEFYTGDPYAGLMVYLHDVDATLPIWALSTQDMLLSIHRNSTTGLGSGISAMPSMHLATTMLTVLFAFRVRRWLGYCALAFLIAMVVGSVHLGWHYVTDGLVSILLTPVLWWIAGWLAGLPYGRGSAGAAAA